MPAAAPISTPLRCRPGCAQRIAGYKVPAVVSFHTELPREDTGKIFKRSLREPYWEGVDRRI